MTPENLLTQWARLVVGSLVQAGVRQLVVSPGSRSTPLLWAALSQPALSCRSIWDERAAAFFALGQARVSGEPSALLCTSGSAGSNYFPAVIEASLSRLPLLIVTADRPFELGQCAANQSIDQTRLFGGACRAFFELGMPEAEPSALEGVARALSQAVLRTCHPEPGPVHVNVRARKPLEPAATESPEGQALEARVSALLERGPIRALAPRASAPEPAIARIAEACRRARRGLLIAGPLAATDPDATAAIREVARQTGFPLLAEAASQLRRRGLEGPLDAPRIDTADWLLGSAFFSARWRPELVVSFGAPPTSSVFEAWLARPELERYVVARHGFPDPHGLARELVLGDVAQSAAALVSELSRHPVADGPERREFRAAFARAQREALAAVERELEGGDPLSEPRAVRAVVGALPERCTLILGNSLPIREVDRYATSLGPQVRVLCQRGASGIEGLVSGAIGSASLGSEPVALLVGDVSFLHDLTGLGAARELRAPLAVVVLDNGGGRIFEALPMARHFAAVPGSDAFWITPPGADLSHAAALFGLRYARVEQLAAIGPALRAAFDNAGLSVVHVVVPPKSASQVEGRVRAELEPLLARIS